jgi:hypothetical protein
MEARPYFFGLGNDNRLQYAISVTDADIIMIMRNGMSLERLGVMPDELLHRHHCVREAGSRQEITAPSALPRPARPRRSLPISRLGAMIRVPLSGRHPDRRTREQRSHLQFGEHGLGQALPRSSALTQIGP